MFDWLKKLIVGETPLDIGEHRCETCGKTKADRKFSWPTAKECKACYMKKWNKRKKRK